MGARDRMNGQHDVMVLALPERTAWLRQCSHGRVLPCGAKCGLQGSMKQGGKQTQTRFSRQISRRAQHPGRLEFHEQSSEGNNVLGKEATPESQREEGGGHEVLLRDRMVKKNRTRSQE